MDYRKQTNGWRTFQEHWSISFVGFTALVTSLVIGFFMRLNGTPWIGFLIASFAFMTLGGGLITYAKLPVYQSGRFLTFGLNSIPEPLQGSYRWGWGVFLFGVVLSLCLLLSKG
jgi:hypothetical protein